MKFDAWIKAPVRVDSYIIKRGEWIREFVRNGLYPWVKSKGYTWAISETQLRNAIATGLYENIGVSYLSSVWNYPVSNTETHEYDKSHFYHILSLDEWDKFWLTWGNMSDVSNDNFRGQDRRFDIQEFIWGQLDLVNSPQTTVVDEMLEDPVEEEDLRSSRVDMYVQDHYEKY
jgi:hypothetical protein